MCAGNAPKIPGGPLPCAARRRRRRRARSGCRSRRTTRARRRRRRRSPTARCPRSRSGAGAGRLQQVGRVALLLDRRRRRRRRRARRRARRRSRRRRRTARRGLRAPSVPKLMLIASAPWSAAQTIAVATLESLRSVLTIEQPAAEARAGEADAVVAGARRPARRRACRGRPRRGRRAGGRVVVEVDGPAMRPASSGWVVVDAGVDDRDARARAADTSQAAGKLLRAAHHCDRRAGRACRAPVSGVDERRVVGHVARAARGARARRDATRGSARRRAASARRPSPGARAHGDQADLRDAEAGAAARRRCAAAPAAAVAPRAPAGAGRAVRQARGHEQAPRGASSSAARSAEEPRRPLRRASGRVEAERRSVAERELRVLGHPVRASTAA